jgi:hypothetical protein
MTSRITPNAIWISLTNTSSRIIRPVLLQRIIRTLNQYEIYQTVIKEGTTQNKYRTYNTPDMVTFMTVFTLTEKEISPMNTKPKTTMNVPGNNTHQKSCP